MKPEIGMWLRQREQGYWAHRERLDMSRVISGIIVGLESWDLGARKSVMVRSCESGNVSNIFDAHALWNLWTPIPLRKSRPKWMPDWLHEGRELTFKGKLKLERGNPCSWVALAYDDKNDLGSEEKPYTRSFTREGSKFVVGEVRGCWVRLNKHDGSFYRLILGGELLKNYHPSLSRFERVLA